MSVRVEVRTPGGLFWRLFGSHEAVWLDTDEEWSDFECDCHCPGCGAERTDGPNGGWTCACGNDLREEWGDDLIWPGTIDTEGLI
jgi:hypothetical protein